MLDRNQLYGKLKETENELYEAKKRLDEARDDTNKKTKYIDKLKEIQEKVDYQENEIKKNENELNVKNEIIKNLEKEEIEISKKLAKEVKKLKHDFNEVVINKEDEFDKAFNDKGNRLSKLNNNVKKIKDYIKENNNKIIT